MKKSWAFLLFAFFFGLGVALPVDDWKTPILGYLYCSGSILGANWFLLAAFNQKSLDSLLTPSEKHSDWRKIVRGIIWTFFVVVFVAYLASFYGVKFKTPFSGIVVNYIETIYRIAIGIDVFFTLAITFLIFYVSDANNPMVPKK